MKRNMLKLMCAILLIIILSVLYITPYCYAGQGDINTNNYKPTKEGGTRAAEIGNKIIGILQQIGSIVSVIALVGMGIKYMVGSTEEKAEYKKTMMPYFIGAILVFATTNVLAMISNIFE